MFSTQVVNSASPSISWNFGDGTTGSGNPAVHTFSQGEYLVTLTVNDGAASYTVRHDVSEIANLPSKPFVTPSSASQNTSAPCKANSTTLPGIIGNVANSNGGADLSGALTTSLLMKHTLDYPCTMFGFSVFVELHDVSVTVGPVTTTDCTSFSSGPSCDVVGNFQQGPGYLNGMRWEAERHWTASGQLDQFGALPQAGQHLDVQGFVYYSFNAPVDATHDFSGWYLELTAWKPTQAPTLCTRADFNGDGTVNIIDLTLLAVHYRAQVGQTAYDPRFDLNNDGKIDILDLSELALVFGMQC